MAEMKRSHQRTFLVKRMHFAGCNSVLYLTHNSKHDRMDSSNFLTISAWSRMTSIQMRMLANMSAGMIPIRNNCRWDTVFVVSCMTRVVVKMPSRVM